MLQPIRKGNNSSLTKLKSQSELTKPSMNTGLNKPTLGAAPHTMTLVRCSGLVTVNLGFSTGQILTLYLLMSAMKWKWVSSENPATLDSLRTGRSGYRILVRARSSVLSRPESGPTQSPVQWVPGLCPGDKVAGAWHCPIPLLPLWGFMANSRVNFSSFTLWHSKHLVFFEIRVSHNAPDGDSSVLGSNAMANGKYS
jgi:hypothetical protein